MGVELGRVGAARGSGGPAGGSRGLTYGREAAYATALKEALEKADIVWGTRAGRARCEEKVRQQQLRGSQHHLVSTLAWLHTDRVDQAVAWVPDRADSEQREGGSQPSPAEALRAKFCGREKHCWLFVRALLPRRLTPPPTAP